MKEVKTIHLLVKMNYLIFMKDTGTPKQFAEKLQQSVSNTHRLISILKSAGAPIRYCRQTQTYIYIGGGNFFIGFLKDMTNPQIL